MATENKSETRIVVKAILSYVSVFKPYKDPEDPEDKGKYKTLLIIDKDDTVSVGKIRKAIKFVEEKMITDKFAGKRPKKAIKNIFRDGDEDKDDELFENKYYMNVSKHIKPAIVDRKLNPITDESQVYSGILANVCIDFYYYFRKDGQGITASLESIQKISDGEPLGASRVRAEDVFKEMEEDDEDYDDLD